MPHRRHRLISEALIKRMKLWPVVGILGPRQSGKSTLLRDIFSEIHPLEYITLDSLSVRKRAEGNPESISEIEHGKTKVFDEIQKVPDLFDAIKLHVDRRRRPGMYILSGSTHFSQQMGIRESLTGRIALMYLYPFCLSEVHNKSFGNYFKNKSNCSALLSLSEFDRKIKHGGMPGFFYLHSPDEFSTAARSWIETTCFRDLGQALKRNFDPELALNILTAVTQADVPSATVVASNLEIDTRVVTRYLDAFTEILTLKKIAPHTKGVGKPHYLMFDSGLATYLGASRQTALRIHVMIEALSFFESKNIARPQVEYYQSEKNSYIPLVFSWKNERKMTAIQISDREAPKLGEVASLKSFQSRLELNLKCRFLLLGHFHESYFENKIEYHPLRG